VASFSGAAGGEEEEQHRIVAVVVILVLCILWAVVLIPPILRSRAESGHGQVTGGMGQVLSIFSSAVGRVRGYDRDGGGVEALMGPVGPTGPMGGMGLGAPARAPGGMTTSQRRRRDVLVGLLCAVGITLIMAAFSNGSIVFFGLNFICDAALGGYIYLLLQMKSRQQSPRATLPASELAGRRLRSVPPLADTSRGAEPMLAMRRTATY